MGAGHTQSMAAGRDPSTRVRWLVVLVLIATACTSEEAPETARGPTADEPSAPPSFGSTDDVTIAFHADPGGRDDTYSMDAAGGQLVPVTDGIETVAQPYCRPTGRDC